MDCLAGTVRLDLSQGARDYQHYHHGPNACKTPSKDRYQRLVYYVDFSALGANNGLTECDSVSAINRFNLEGKKHNAMDIDREI